MKKIAVLTSGGDSPGMNAAIRAVVRAGIHNGLEVFGVSEGYKGLLENEITPMNYRSVSEMMNRGGTILKTARCKEFMHDEYILKGIENLKALGIEGLAVIGGDGSFRGAKDLSRLGMPTVGIPATIDNDIACTDYTIGFDTALNTACECIDKLKDTGASHNRCNVIEVMGRHAGHIALEVGIANGAEVIIVPETPFDLKTDIVERINQAAKKGKKHFVVIVAEGIEGVDKLAIQIETLTEISTRATILGHMQRGGTPTVKDRVMASRMGVYAVELLMEDKGNRVVAWKNGRIVDYDINEALEMKKTIDADLYNVYKTVTE